MQIFWGIIYALLTGSILFYYIPKIRKLINEINATREALVGSQLREDQLQRSVSVWEDRAIERQIEINRLRTRVTESNSTIDLMRRQHEALNLQVEAITSERQHLISEIQRLTAHTRVYQAQLRNQGIPEPSPELMTNLENAERIANQQPPLGDVMRRVRAQQEAIRRVMTNTDNQPTESDDQRRARLMGQHESVQRTVSLTMQQRERERLAEIARLAREQQMPLFTAEQAEVPIADGINGLYEEPVQAGNGIEYEPLTSERLRQHAALMGVQFIPDTDQQPPLRSYFDLVRNQTVSLEDVLTPQEQELSDKIEELSNQVLEKDNLITLLKNLVSEFHANAVYKESDGDKRRFRLPISIAITVEELLNK